MTRIEAEATGGISDEARRGSDWSQLLVPIVTAALVLALGLLLVGVTSNNAETHPVPGAATQTPLR